MNRLPTDNEKVPVFKSWGAWYRMVIAFLVVVMILFYLFTKHYS